MEKEILWNLECAEANLKDDIQALAYIQDTCETKKRRRFFIKSNRNKKSVANIIKINDL